MVDTDISKQFLNHSDTDGLETINISQNELATNANEIASLNQYIAERGQRLKVKIDLREKNQNAEALRLDENYLKKLDSSIKKVTSFIKRLKGLTESQKDALSKEILQLNLSKYLSEVAAAFIEAKLKMNDIPCALHLCSLMHQNYAEFSALLFEQWQKILNLKKDEKVANPSKLRVDLRFFAELITIGILPAKESLSLLGNQLTILTHHDKEYANISIITSFCKHCGEDFEDLIPLKYEKLALKHNIKIPPNTIYSVERQKAVKALFKEYFRSLVQHLLNEHKEIQRLERQNKKIYQTKGELNSEKKEKFENTYSQYKKLIENIEILSELVGEKMPDLPLDELNKKDEDTINIDIFLPGKNEEFDSNTSPWEDDETRQFYECLPDLKPLIPGLIAKEIEKASIDINKQDPEKIIKTSENQEQDQATSSSSSINSETDASNESALTVNIDDEMAKIEKEIQELENQSAINDLNPVAEEEILGTSDDKELDSLTSLVIGDELKEVKADIQATITSKDSKESNSLANANLKILMDSFIAQLPNCVNRELIDKAAKEFCTNLNTKLNRKRLVGALFQVQRTRLDLLPFYSRFVAILNPCMPEISTDLSTLLLSDFRFHVRKKDQINIESKIKTARFIGELVKFNMFSKLEALNCLKNLLADFKYHNIEMFCNLLDVCGRFLYRNQESHMKLKLLLEILMRKKTATSMDSRYSIMIENVFYYCNPPENKQTEKKILSPMHEYIKKCLYKDLNKLCVEKILRQMRKLNWKDEEIKQFMVKCLIAAWNLRYNSIHCMANLVSGLALYYEEIGTQVVDGVIEEIRLGLETNLPKFNQRRVSIIKYLGELYNYRMVESAIIFKTFYTLITFGINHDNGDSANNESLDPIDNFFRVKLVCVLLDTCGQYFDRGSTKKKLDCFLLYLQRYYLFKKEALTAEEQYKNIDPMEVEYVLTESILNLRPNFKFLKTFKEACEAVEKMETEIKETLSKTMPSLMNEVFNETKSGNELVSNGLEAIREDEEEYGEDFNQQDRNESDYEDENEEDEDEDNENDIKNRSRKNRMDGEDLLTSMNINDDNGCGDDDDEEAHELNANTNSEAEENLVITKPRVAKQEISKEDEDFMKAFETMVTENIAQRTKDSNKLPTVDISVPMISKKLRATLNNETGNENVAAPNLGHLKSFNLSKISAPEKPQVDTQSETKNKGFSFLVMVKKGNKTQYHNMEVPVTSEFANQFRAKEEAERVEKEKLKQLTLNINDRIEQEEFQEMIQTNQSRSYGNSNRDRYQKYNHPKGAPDADLIFGASGGNTNR